MSVTPSSEQGRIYRFDRFELFPETGELRKQGAIVHLAPQPFRVLAMLVARGGAIVTREEIQEDLWGEETFVGYEQGINVVIRRIRFALNDDAETPRYLQTHPRRGYSFLAPVECVIPERAIPIEPVVPETESVPTPSELPPPPVTTSGAVRIRAALVSLVFTCLLFATHSPRGESAPRAPRVLHVAVADLGSPSHGASLDSRELLAEVRSRLAHVQPASIRVVAPGAAADVRVDATLRADGEGLIADTRLIDASSGQYLWAETFRGRGAPNDFSLEVATRITRAVIELHVPPRQHHAAARADVSPRALALYREGQRLQTLPVPQRNCDRALALYEDALRLDPDFADAWAAIGEVWAERVLTWKGPSRRTAINEARLAFARTLELDPRNAPSINNRGVLLMNIDRDYEQAEREMRRAIAADPEYVDAHVNLAALLSASGRHTEALATMRNAQLLDPASYVPSPRLAYLYLMARRYSDAVAEYRASILVFRENRGLHWGLMSAAVAAREWDDAAQSLSVLLGEPVEIPRDSAQPGAAFRKQMMRLERELLANGEETIDPYQLACFYAQAGDADRAFAALDRAAVAQSFHALFADVDPRLDPIRDDPRFVDRLEQLGLLR